MTFSLRELNRSWRRTLLIAHVVTSVGWLGVSFAMLALAITARATRDIGSKHSAYWAMNLLVDVVVGPASLAALLTGIVIGLATPWGVLRYRWVVLKLVANIVAAGLSLFLLPVRTGAALRASASVDPAAIRHTGTDLIAASSVSITLYAAMTAVSVVKPWGRTRWGVRQRHLEGAVSRTVRPRLR